MVVSSFSTDFGLQQSAIENADSLPLELHDVSSSLIFSIRRKINRPVARSTLRQRPFS